MASAGLYGTVAQIAEQLMIDKRLGHVRIGQMSLTLNKGRRGVDVEREWPLISSDNRRAQTRDNTCQLEP